MRCSSPAIWIQESGLRPLTSDLQRRRMARDVTAGIASIRVPAWADIAAVAKIRRIEAQTGDDREGMPGPRINRDPASATAFAVTHEIARRQRRRQQSRAMQRIRNRARAIVAT